MAPIPIQSSSLPNALAWSLQHPRSRYQDDAASRSLSSRFVFSLGRRLGESHLHHDLSATSCLRVQSFRSLGWWPRQELFRSWHIECNRTSLALKSRCYSKSSKLQTHSGRIWHIEDLNLLSLLWWTHWDERCRGDCCWAPGDTREGRLHGGIFRFWVLRRLFCGRWGRGPWMRYLSNRNSCLRMNDSNSISPTNFSRYHFRPDVSKEILIPRQGPLRIPKLDPWPETRSAGSPFLVVENLLRAQGFSKLSLTHRISTNSRSPTYCYQPLSHLQLHCRSNTS